jgi:hypothetical protein
MTIYLPWPFVTFIVGFAAGAFIVWFMMGIAYEVRDGIVGQGGRER